VARFHAEHQRLFAHSAAGDSVEIVSLRLVAVGAVQAPEARERPAGGAATPKDTRPVYFVETDGFVDCPIYERAALGPGAEFAGPAIVEQMDSTTVVHPGQAASVDAWGNLIIRTGG
jgi:N-methylhydantoinase A